MSILLMTCLGLFKANAQCIDRFLEKQSDSIFIERDIVFGGNISENGEFRALDLDIYHPAANEGLRPLVIMVHGGSFTGGNKTDGEVAWFCEDLAKRGILAASQLHQTPGCHPGANWCTHFTARQDRATVAG